MEIQVSPVPQLFAKYWSMGIQNEKGALYFKNICFSKRNTLLSNVFTIKIGITLPTIFNRKPALFLCSIAIFLGIICVLISYKFYVINL